MCDNQKTEIPPRSILRYHVRNMSERSAGNRLLLEEPKVGEGKQ
jgi:hypothetical protein